MTGAAFPVASLIKRKQNFGNEAPAFTQHRLYHVGRSAFETRQVRITLELQDVVEHEVRVPQGRGINGHLSSPCCCRAGQLHPLRSAASRGGKEGDSTFRSRWSPVHKKKKTNKK